MLGTFAVIVGALTKALDYFDGIFDLLADDHRGDRVMALLLSCYAVAWTLFETIAKSDQDIHPDMAEMAAWARTLQPGTPKHPPMGSWLLHFWFEIFPRTDWSFYLFSALLGAVALWISWRISQRYMPREKCIFGIALLTLVPFYNFHALKFNANSVLTPLWALSTWWFLLSFEMGTAGWAVLAGAAAAAAILGKYWSIILVLTFGVAAFFNPNSDRYFNSPAPYISLAAATILITPNLYWMIEHSFSPLNYAFESHPASYFQALKSAIVFLAASLLYIIVPLGIGVIVTRPGMATFTDVLLPSDPRRRLIVIIFAMPFLLAVVVALLLKVQIESLWAISTMTLLPVLLFSSPLVHIPRKTGVIALSAAIMFPFVMIAVAPVFAVTSHFGGVDNSQDQYAQIAKVLKTSWEEQTSQPLRVIGSYSSVVNGAAFYLQNAPLTFDLYAPATTPWVDEGEIRRYGMAMICPETIYTCLRILGGFSDHYDATFTKSISLTRKYFGRAGTVVPYRIVIVPPKP